MGGEAGEERHPLWIQHEAFDESGKQEAEIYTVDDLLTQDSIGPFRDAAPGEP